MFKSVHRPSHHTSVSPSSLRLVSIND
eukprot:UN17037